MKILVSSKKFVKIFKSIANQNILSVTLINGVFGVTTEKTQKTIAVQTPKNDDYGYFKQQNVRWDWLLRDMAAIGEQPITIEFGNNSAKFTLSY